MTGAPGGMAMEDLIAGIWAQRLRVALLFLLFLLARWPAMRSIPDGGALRDSRGNRVARSVLLEGGRRWGVEDRLSGPFRAVA